MRFTYGEYGIEINPRENFVDTITVENPIAFRKMVGDIWSQCNGADGKWILAEGDKEIPLERICDIIINPFSIDVNDKKMLSSLYSQMNGIATEEYMEDIMRINSEIVSLLDRIMGGMAYPIVTDINLDVNSLLKSYHVCFEEEEGIDKIVNYIRLKHQVLGKTVFFWVNCKHFISEDEFDELVKSISYEKIHLILLEGVESNRQRFEQSIILDKDLCII